MGKRVQAGLRAFMFMTLVVAFVVASGCSESDGVPLGGIIPETLNAAGAAAVPGTLYVANPLASTVLRFRPTDSGNDVAPEAVLRGVATGLDRPTQLAVDAGRNLLYVLDNGRVLVFASAAAAGGNQPPVRVITPAVVGAQSIAVDAVRDILYLGHGNAAGLTAYDGASGLSGSITATRSLAGTGTTLNAPFGLALDGADRLAIADLHADLVSQYDTMSTRTGELRPDRSIGGAATQLVDPFGVCVDGTGALIVADVGTQTLSVFGAGASGNRAPDARVASSVSLLVDPRQLACADGVTVYVADGASGTVKSYRAEDLRAGRGAPVRAFSAASAGLSIPTGVAHDPTH